MFKKVIVTISLALPLVVGTVAAQAGSTITEKSYWPNQAGATAYAGQRIIPNAAYLLDSYGQASAAKPQLSMAEVQLDGGNVLRYHGGPKNQ